MSTLHGNLLYMFCTITDHPCPSPQLVFWSGALGDMHSRLVWHSHETIQAAGPNCDGPHVV